ncbi:MAG: GLUG motif-containing protein, partial [Oscillospiraceae bacterium]
VSPDPTPTPTSTPTPTPTSTSNSQLLGAGGNTIYIPLGFAGCTINLTADIDLSAYSGGSVSGDTEQLTVWRPIGDTNTPFLGTLNGAQKKVSNFVFPIKNTYPNYGLFGVIGVNGAVKDLNFDLANPFGTPATPKPFAITANPAANGVKLPIVGIVAAVNKGSVENCSVTNATVTLDSTTNLEGQHTFGGIVGKNDGTAVNIAKVKDCSFSGNITAVGETYDFLVPDTIANATHLNGIGGIAGYSFGSIQGCTTKNTAISYVTNSSGLVYTYVKVGGIVGHLFANGTTAPSITDDVIGCTFLGSIKSDEGTAYQAVGGIFGYGADGVRVTNCAVAANIQVGNLNAKDSSDIHGGLGGIGGNLPYGYSPKLSGCSSAGTLSG